MNGGTVFSIPVAGGPLTTLYTFPSGSAQDGPHGRLLLSPDGSTLYGTTFRDGSSNLGSVFSLSTSGGPATILHDFTGTGEDGSLPNAGLTLSLDGTTLYGDTIAGGTDGFGTLFSFSLTSNTYTTLYNFTGGNDGGNPEATLTLSGNNLYGTTAAYGSGGGGTLFAFDTSSGEMTVPEPSTWGMVLVGLGLLAWRPLRPRRRKN